MTATATGQTRTTTLTLGTDYPTRLAALNPPPASGTVQTTEREEITVEIDGEDDFTAETRQLEYEANYNELQNAPTYRFDNTVAYQTFDQSDGSFAMSSQQLVSGSTLNLVPIRGEFAESRTGAAEVEFQPLETETIEEDIGKVRIPSELSEDEWERLLEGDDVGVNDVGRDGDIIEIDFEDGEVDEVRNLPIGVGEIDPEENGLEEREGGLDGGDNGFGEGESGINPTDDAFALVDTNILSPDEIEFVLENRGDSDRSIEDVQFTVYFEPNDVQEQVTVDREGEVLELRGDFRSLNRDSISPGERESIQLNFDDPAQQALIGITVRDDDGQQALYLGGGDEGGDQNIDANRPDGFDLAADSDDQTQELEFEILNEDLNEGGQPEVTIDLPNDGDDPGQGEVDYTSADVDSISSDEPEGLEAEIIQDGDAIEVSTENNQDAIVAGTTVTLTLDDIETGPTSGSDESFSKTVTFTRNDEPDNPDSTFFFVEQQGIEFTDIDDLGEDESDQDQEFDFEILDQDLPGDEQVDLTLPGTDDIDYSRVGDEDVTTSDGETRATIDSEAEVITIELDDEDAFIGAGTEITVEIEEAVETSEDSAGNYFAEIERTDTGAEDSGEFEVGDAGEISWEDVSDIEEQGDNIEQTFEFELSEQGFSEGDTVTIEVEDGIIGPDNNDDLTYPSDEDEFTFDGGDVDAILDIESGEFSVEIEAEEELDTGEYEVTISGINVNNDIDEEVDAEITRGDTGDTDTTDFDVDTE
ncbi:MAG: hypothetical protein PPP58_06845 [Natronomonas sp.]